VDEVLSNSLVRQKMTSPATHPQAKAHVTEGDFPILVWAAEREKSQLNTPHQSQTSKGSD
jgi:hypothetical protein